MNTPTPETDAETMINDGTGIKPVPYVSADFARKLERERDTLRKVCDDLAKRIFMNCDALTAYNNLPYVKERNTK